MEPATPVESMSFWPVATTTPSTESTHTEGGTGTTSSSRPTTFYVKFMILGFSDTKNKKQNNGYFYIVNPH